MLLFFAFLLVLCTQGQKYTIVQKGTANMFSHRIYYVDAKGHPISPFHDIPLQVRDGVFNMVVEIPRWSNAKFEITKEEKLNPIIQDTKVIGSVRKLRFVNNVFPYHGYIWNYGALPQTWEDPAHVDPNTGVGGDNDPVDIVEIGRSVGYVGEVKQVKLLGVIALVDKDETDWKVMCIDITDPMAEKLHDIGDVDVHMPGLLAATRDFFRNYKVPQGGVVNRFGFDGKWQGRAFTETLLEETHGKWRKLMSRSREWKIKTENTSNRDTPGFITAREAWSYIKLNSPFNPNGPSPSASIHHPSYVQRTVSEPVCDAVLSDLMQSCPT